MTASYGDTPRPDMQQKAGTRTSVASSSTSRPALSSISASPSPRWPAQRGAYLRRSLLRTRPGRGSDKGDRTSCRSANANQLIWALREAMPPRNPLRTAAPRSTRPGRSAIRHPSTPASLRSAMKRDLPDDPAVLRAMLLAADIRLAERDRLKRAAMTETGAESSVCAILAPWARLSEIQATSQA
jgi:hypothetical protein